MKPISYQSMPSSVNTGHPSITLDRVLTSSNVMYCDKCGFGSADPAVFKKHRLEHLGTRFYCFYCNHVFSSEAELHAHVKSHTAKYPFTCPHCGQGYMRRLCLVKHIDRLHSKSMSPAAAKPGAEKSPHVAVSSASTSAPSAAAPSSLRPLVRVTVPPQSASAVRLGKDQQRGKTLDTNTSQSTAELLPPFNGLTQQNRALTVPLPEELNIPAGCMVELVEVKTVNGTKELKLRLVSQQENESVIKDTRSTVFENNQLGKPLSSTFNHPNTAKSVSLGMCSVNRKPHEMKNVNVEPPTVVPVNIYRNLPNQVSKDKNGLKRTSHEIIDLVGNSVIPNKVSKSIFNPVREGNNGIKLTQRETMNHNAAPPTVASNRLLNRLPGNMHPENIAACVSQRAADQRSNSTPQPAKSTPIRRASDTQSAPRDMSMAVKLEPGVRLSNSTALNLSSNQQIPKSASPSSLCGSSVSAPQIRPLTISVPAEKVANQSFSAPRAKTELSLAKTPALCNGTHSKVSAWKREVRLNEGSGEKDKPEQESFPVISSVFSLSQQPEDVQGSIQPLVMAALRGIVMNKSSGSSSKGINNVTNGTNLVKELPPLNHRVQLASKEEPLTHNLLTACCKSGSVKEEEPDKETKSNDIHVKQENKCSMLPEDGKHSLTPDFEPSTIKEPLSKSEVGESRTVEPEEQPRHMHDVSSKFLTVSLKRVQVGVWKQSKKGLKLRISKCKTQGHIGRLNNCTVFYPMPLKEDQLVKRPGPNQPVVVLNHPQPRVSVPAARADTSSNTGAFEVAPKCQILKMRLSKVVGQKYEVMGCTVGVFS